MRCSCSDDTGTIRTPPDHLTSIVCAKRSPILPIVVRHPIRMSLPKLHYCSLRFQFSNLKCITCRVAVITFTFSQHVSQGEGIRCHTNCLEPRHEVTLRDHSPQAGSLDNDLSQFHLGFLPVLSLEAMFHGHGSPPTYHGFTSLFSTANQVHSFARRGGISGIRPSRR